MSKRKSTNDNNNNSSNSDGKYTILSYFSPVAKKPLSSSNSNTPSITSSSPTTATSSINKSTSTINNNNNNNQVKSSPITPRNTKQTNGKRKLSTIKKELDEKNSTASSENKKSNSSPAKDNSIDSKQQSSKKRRRILEFKSDDEEEEEDDLSADDDDDDDNYVPDKLEKENESEEDEVTDEDIADDSVETEEDSPIKSVPKKKNQSTKAKPLLLKDEDDNDEFENKIKSLIELSTNVTFQPKEELIEEPDEENELTEEPTVWLHNKLEFLRPENIKDREKRKPTDPNYDGGTLYVPEKYLNTLTPAMRQWWELKSDNFDCVLFFKVGKFYELYHMDADVGVAELGFTFMRGEFAHSGFPEQSFDRMANNLVSRGFKVARVEQTETPDMMQERIKTQQNVTKFDKVVSREICQITNRGTRVFGQQVAITNNYQPNYMIALAEKKLGQHSRYGICFIDTSIGEFKLGEFQDDKQCSRLLTLLAHSPPILILYEKGGVAPHTNKILKTILSHTLNESLLSGSQFWSAEKTLKVLSEKYFRPKQVTGSSTDERLEWPSIFNVMKNKDDNLGLTPNDDYCLALRSFGACLWYLSKCLIDQQILAMAQYQLYVPPDEMNMMTMNTNNKHNDDVDETNLGKIEEIQRKLKDKMGIRYMVLDSITLNNLKIIGKTPEEPHTLFITLDMCCTRFGKRLLHNWLCAPSNDKQLIIDRQCGVKELIENRDLLQEVRLLLGELPDLERLLAQIHTFGNAYRSKSHPDGRAFLFEQKSYNKKKINDFCSTLTGFNALAQLPKLFAKCTSTFLQKLTQFTPIGGLPDITESLEYFKNAFDHDEALKSGVIAPEAGVDQEYDECERTIQSINDDLNKYLCEQEKVFGCSLSYFGIDKKRFQLEIPEKKSQLADSNYFLESQRTGSKPVNRYYTNETQNLLKRMLMAEEQRTAALKDISRRIFERFSKEYNIWKLCVDLASILDVLTAFATYGQNLNELCFPEILDNNEGPILEIENSFHPCMTPGDDFIPNGITLGRDEPPLALLTGPNMGGKSTLMRQIGLLAVMTQIGCPIPATNCRMSLIDRIFTRLGAQDDIMAGHSTFLVELSETSVILKHATIYSLVLLDELGRGTATYDGTSVASAVVNFLANVKCRTLFSTHYHNLVDGFHDDPRIKLGHMACMVENEDDDDPTQECVTFLYKYTSGACPKSYGFNAAKLGGMPLPIIRRAYELSKKVEGDVIKKKLFAAVAEHDFTSKSTSSLSDIQKLLIKLQEYKINN